MPATPGDQSSFPASGTPLIRQPGKSYQVQQNGLAVYDVEYRGVLSEGDTLEFKQGDSPAEGEYPDVILLSFKIIGDDTICGGVRVQLHYEGKADEKYTDPTVSDDVTLEYVPNHDDIYSHPDFKEFAGTSPADAVHGAQFLPNPGGGYKFDFFNIVDPAHPDEKNKYAGITTYICPAPVITLNNIATEWPDENELTAIGKIDDPTNYTENAPTLPAGTDDQERNWLYESTRIRNIANKWFEQTRVFQGSGPRPINVGIYGNPPDFT